MFSNHRHSQDPNKRPYAGVPRQGWGFLIAMVVISLLVHLGSYLNFERFLSGRADLNFSNRHKNPIKVRIVSKAKPKPQNPIEPDAQKILETPLAQTEKPVDPKYKGAQDHKTEKETKVARQIPHVKGLDPGQGGSGQKTKPKVAAQKPAEPPKLESKQKLKPQLGISGGIAVRERNKPKPRNKYESLMPTSVELQEELAAGYQDYVDDDIAVGDRVDINTSDFRYIGYFTTMRKAIELVWNYPYEAVRRGIQGEVGLEFTILKDGTTKGVRVISSSGYPMLDNAIVQAIKLASPFSPLPEGFGKDKLTITGSFRYVLTSYADAF